MHENKLKIDKPYIDCDHHHNGYVTLLIAETIGFLYRQQPQILILTLNIHNHPEIAIYRCYRSEITGDGIAADIDSNFFMNIH